MDGIGCEIYIKVVTIIAWSIKYAWSWPEIVINTNNLFWRVAEGGVTIETISVPDI